MSEESFDIRRLREVTEGDVAVEAQLFELFDDTLHRCVTGLGEALAAADDQKWAEAAHELKGASGSLGAPKLSRFCASAETCEKVDRPAALEEIQKEAEYVKGLVDNARGVA
jgi:HPt (histidine-containing phosphotransfer) domain-containing protein